jgi:hypothetical protein
MIFALLMSGCVIGSDKYPRPRDLPRPSLVDRLRVLAVKAEPPEARPGDTITFEGLIVDPNEESPVVVWLACPAEDESGVGFGCALDLDAIDFETATLEELAEAGVIGFEPGLSPTYTAPMDLLSALPEEERAEGIYVTIQVMAIPADLFAPEQASGDFDFNQVEIAYKRLIVSEATTPNNNPEIIGFNVDDEEIAAGSIVEVAAGEIVTLEPLFSNESIEVYEYTNSQGITETRTEEPYVTWYTTGGDLLSPYSVHPYRDTAWSSPKDSDISGIWWAVVRDRRGGMTWYEQPWTTN